MGNVIGGYEYSHCALHIAHCALIGRGKGSMKEANLGHAKFPFARLTGVVNPFLN
jgi:hypothetical protein